MVRKAISLLVAAAAGAALSRLALRTSFPGALPRRPEATDPSIPPSESSATRFRDRPGQAQEDADQEPL